MTALEWLQVTFAVVGDEFAWGTERRSGIVSTFLAMFGDTIQSALDAGRDPVDNLCALPADAKRGWGADFESWRTL